jgi:hypothetical protein
MNCVFQPADCPALLTNYKCYRCANCQKTLSIAVSFADSRESLFAQFTTCAAGKSSQTTQVTTQVTMWDPIGPGTVLRKLLARLHITIGPDCSCLERLELMNNNGLAWCEENMTTLLLWLKDEASNRKLIFLTLPAKIVVQRALKIARRRRDKRATQP